MWGKGIMINKKERYIFVGHFKEGKKHGPGYSLPIGNILKKEILQANWTDDVLSKEDEKKMHLL